MVSKNKGKLTKGAVQKMVGKPGALHDALGVPRGQKIPKSKLKAAAKRKGKVGIEARNAEKLIAIRKNYLKRTGKGKKK